MPIRFTNTLSGEKENLVVPQDRDLRLFVCGPTVYDEIHLGNARTYAVFDTLAKYLRSQGIQLFYLKNITDVDDKIIARANEEKVEASVIAKRYTKAFKDMSQKLNFTAVTHYAAATDFIPDIVKQIQTLIEKKNAYEIKGDGWYFDLSTFPEYGKLAKRTIQEAEDGVSRIDENSNKRNRGDFCLWKFSKPGEPTWNTTLGKGRPGWHIEDTAITEHFFGPQYDLHGGGRDLIFPHHEAEIAQQESASGKKPFVAIWLHAGLVTMDGKKMSKSLKNFTTVADFLERHSANVFRLFIARHHYRSSVNVDDSSITETETILSNIEETFAKLSLVVKRSKEKSRTSLGNLNELFTEAMNDDLNTPEAIAAIFKYMNALNTYMWKLTPKEAEEAQRLISEKLAILGVVLTQPTIPLRIRFLARFRELLRNHQQFIKADALRKKIEALGYSLDDTPLGPLLSRKRAG